MDLNKKLKKGLEKLRIKYNGIILYKAGSPGYSKIFARDGIISAVLMQDAEMLKDQLIFCAQKQGKKINPYTGEEQGKIFHEHPGLEIRGFSTEYNASENTALFLIGHEIYYKITNDKSLIEIQKTEIKSAVDYIKRHLTEEGAFIEDPKFSGAEKFALKVTYWKDSALPKRENGEPSYPIIYSLAHIQNMRALKSAAFLLNDGKLNETVSLMRKYLNEKLIDSTTGIFYLAVDKKGRISAISSDILHALFYLDPKDISKEVIQKIEEKSKLLETEIGYRTLSKNDASLVDDNYHSKTVWPFEQAIIHIGARKFGLEHVKEVSSKILKVLDTEPEIFVIDGKTMKKSGCDPQLWTIATKKYFQSL